MLSFRQTIAALAGVCLASTFGATMSAQAQTTAVPFKPGQRTLVAIDFTKEPLGSFPEKKLTLLTGTPEVAEQNGTQMLRSIEGSEFIVNLPEVLPTNFTVEFDLLPRQCAGCGGVELAFEGTRMIDRGPLSAHVNWQQETIIIAGGGPYQQIPMPPELVAQFNLPTQVNASFEGDHFRLFTNKTQLFDLPGVKFVRGSILRVWMSGSEGKPTYLSRIRVATDDPATSGSDGTTSPMSNIAPVGGIVASIDGAGLPTLSWTPVPGAAGYYVTRWKTDNTTCCNNQSPPGQPLLNTTWKDTALPQTGIYRWRVMAIMPGGLATGETEVNYVAIAGAGQTQTPNPSTSNIGPLRVPTITGTQEANNQSAKVITSPSGTRIAGPAMSMATLYPASDGTVASVLFAWTPVPKATGYRIWRGSQDPQNPSPAIVELSVTAADAARIIREARSNAPNDATLTAGVIDGFLPADGNVTYWIDATFADGSVSDLSSAIKLQAPTTIVFQVLSFATPANLSFTAGPTVSSGGASGRALIWSWDPVPGAVLYMIKVFGLPTKSPLLGGTPTLILEKTVLAAQPIAPGNTPMPTARIPFSELGYASGPPFTMDVLQSGKVIQFCIAVGHPPDPNQTTGTTCQSVVVP